MGESRAGLHKESEPVDDEQREQPGTERYSQIRQLKRSPALVTKVSLKTHRVHDVHIGAFLPECLNYFFRNLQSRRSSSKNYDIC
eukprot:8359616-Pyramimonas_sp.AAC.2